MITVVGFPFSSHRYSQEVGDANRFSGNIGPIAERHYLNLGIWD